MTVFRPFLWQRERFMSRCRFMALTAHAAHSQTKMPPNVLQVMSPTSFKVRRLDVPFQIYGQKRSIRFHSAAKQCRLQLPVNQTLAFLFEKGRGEKSHTLFLQVVFSCSGFVSSLGAEDQLTTAFIHSVVLS